MSNFPITKDQIFQASNGGLEIFQRLFPQARTDRKFQLRTNDKSASASLKKMKEGNWIVKDFGDYGGFYEKGKDAVNAFAHENGLGFYDALRELGKEYGIVNTADASNFERCDFSEFKGDLNEDGYEIIYNETFTDAELDYLGPLVTEKLCQRYNFRSVKQYSWIKYAEDKKGNPIPDKSQAKVFTKISTTFQPLFALVVEPKKLKKDVAGKSVEYHIPGFVKILQPGDKDFRFRYFGQKSDGHIFGLDVIEKVVEKIKKVDEDDNQSAVKDGLVDIMKTKTDLYKNPKYNLKNNKLKRIIICSGDRDALNMASAGEYVVWFNSETESKKPKIIKMLMKYADEVYNVPDIDITGVEAGTGLALDFLDIKTAWVPTELYNRDNHYLKKIKDFTDWIKTKHNPDDSDYSDIISEVHLFLDNAMSAKFWNEYQPLNKDGDPVGKPKYSIHYLNALYFLQLNGFYRVKDEVKNEEYFVKQTNHVVHDVTVSDIKNFFNVFLKERRRLEGSRFYPDDLLNMVIERDVFSDKKLVSLPEKVFDFSNFSKKSQYFFFKNSIWKITANSIEQITRGYEKAVRDKNIFENKVKEKFDVSINSKKIFPIVKEKTNTPEPFFTWKKNSEGNYELKIIRKDCEFQNYFINGSRIFWEEECRHLPEDQRADYLDANRFVINKAWDEATKTGLTEDQIYEQELHFLNKCYALGYLMHTQKVSSRAWLVYVMDNNVKEEGESEGRTGKSLFVDKAVRLFKESYYIGARDPKITDSEFKYHGVSAETEYLLYDDADRRFDFNKLFTDVTGDMYVNPKSGAPFSLSFLNSPKLALSTNYAPYGLDPSTKDRILFVAFSNWYHGEIEGWPAKKPTHDFGHEFFDGWDDEQWNLFVNFCMQCLQLYLSSPEKIGAPENNIRKRNLLQEMGKIFYEWAEVYFESRKNEEFPRIEAFNACKDYSKKLTDMSAQLFKKRLEQFCEYNEWTLNPKEKQTTKDGRISRSINGHPTEMFYIAVPDAPVTELPFYKENSDDPYGKV